MAISIDRYVDVTSGVGAQAVVPERQLIARLFTDNNKLPPSTYVEFSSAAAVGEYFGTSSEEYKRAVYYFSFVSKNLTSPDVISYARWVDTAVAPRIYGYANPAAPQAVANYTSISTGAFGLTIAGVHNNFSGLDFTSAVTLADVATVLQTAIHTASGTQWTSATVVYNASTATFDFVGGATGAATISVNAGTGGTDISTLIGWLPEATFENGTFSGGGSIVAAGAGVETLTDVLTDSAAQSSNFGSFAFMPGTPLTLTQNIEVATWNKAQGVTYQFHVAITSTNASAWANDTTGMGAIGGSGGTLDNLSDEYAEMLPMMILAATDYEAANSVQNYEFYQSTLTPSVTDDSTADAMDALSINYYGQTQTAGQALSFYQRGVLFGLPTDPLDMNVYANEQWLKDAAQAAVLNLLLSLSRLPANEQGRGQLLTTLQSVVNRALRNGVISVGKTLTNLQKIDITQISGDPNAYYQIQTIGYWLDVVVNPTTNIATYTLIYSKDDVIRKVEGTHVLI